MRSSARNLIFSAIVLVLCGASFMWGRSSASQEWRAQLFDAMTSQRLLWMRTDLTNLTLLREGKVDDAIRGMELVVELGLKALNVEDAKSAHISGPDLDTTKRALMAYQNAFPVTQLDPKRNSNLAKIFE